MTEPVRYLSPEWRHAQFAAAEEAGYIDLSDAGSDCGWGYDGPCGGCDRCCIAQLSHSLMLEERQARTYMAAGLRVAEPLRLDYFEGFGGYHDAYNCLMAGELEGWGYPWAKSEPESV